MIIEYREMACFSILFYFLCVGGGDFLPMDAVIEIMGRHDLTWGSEMLWYGVI